MCPTSGKGECHGPAATINIIPDEILLDIFSICLHDPFVEFFEHDKWEWQGLVHVCRRWRKIIYASSHRLDLHLSCSYRTSVSVRKNLVFWPATLPLTVDYPFEPDFLKPKDQDNLLAALEHPGRVHRIWIFGNCSLLGKVDTFMQKSFPALTHLILVSDANGLPPPFSTVAPVIHGRFLGGSAPHLKHLHLKNISFSALPTFLLSARNLVTLDLEWLSENGYIPPEAMVEILNVLTRLTTLSITIDEDAFLPEQRTSHPDPPMRNILPSLADFRYSGCSEYLEDILAQIDTPRLDQLRIECYMQVQVTQLSQFIGRTENLKFDKFRDAEVTLYDDTYFELNCPQGEQLSLRILNQGWFHEQVPCVANVLGQLVAIFPNVNHLSASGYQSQPTDMDFTDWLPLIRRFPAVKALRLSGGVAPYIASALEDTPEEMVTDVFPALDLIWLDDNDFEREKWEEPLGPESVERFVSLRKLSGRPVTVVVTEDEFDREEKKLEVL